MYFIFFFFFFLSFSLKFDCSIVCVSRVVSNPIIDSGSISFKPDIYHHISNNNNHGSIFCCLMFVYIFLGVNCREYFRVKTEIQDSEIEQCIAYIGSNHDIGISISTTIYVSTYIPKGAAL